MKAQTLQDFWKEWGCDPSHGIRARLRIESNPELARDILDRSAREAQVAQWLVNLYIPVSARDTGEPDEVREMIQGFAQSVRQAVPDLIRALSTSGNVNVAQQLSKTWLETRRDERPRLPVLYRNREDNFDTVLSAAEAMIHTLLIAFEESEGTPAQDETQEPSPTRGKRKLWWIEGNSGGS